MTRRRRLRAALRQLALWTCLALFLLLQQDTHAHSAQSSPRDPRFGVVEAHHAPASADSLGIAWSRSLFHWARIQPLGPHQWIEDELTSDELDQEVRAGRQVIGLLIGVPDWARDETGLPRGLYLPLDDPGNTWAEFVREAVSRYEGRIDHWIIWNEPDIWDQNHPGFTWSGDEGDYVQLLKVAYLVAHEENSHAFIHLAGVTHWWDALAYREPYFQRLMAALASDPEAMSNNYYHDAATLHLYFNPSHVYNIIDQYRGIQAEYGIQKPFWVIETNAAPSSDPARYVENPTFQVSLLEQAAFFPQALSLALAAGADHVGIYKLVDTAGDYAANPEPFGLVRADGTPRPGFRTAQVAIEQLSGVEEAVWTDRQLVAQVAASKPGQVTRILWARVPAAYVVRIPAVAESAVLIDMWGNRTDRTPLGGEYTINLLAGECQHTTGDYCTIGGPPVYVVEEVISGAVIPLDTLALEVQPLEGSTTIGRAVEARRSIVMWAVLTGCILLLAASGLVIRFRTRAAS